MKPFLSGRSVSPINALQPLSGVRPADGLAQANAGVHAHADGGTVSSHAAVECIKQGDKVVRLIVTCSCGERIEIDCLYPPGT